MIPHEGHGVNGADMEEPNTPRRRRTDLSGEAGRFLDNGIETSPGRLDDHGGGTVSDMGDVGGSTSGRVGDMGGGLTVGRSGLVGGGDADESGGELDIEQGFHAIHGGDHETQEDAEA
jgi:hypothetical protein